MIPKGSQTACSIIESARQEDTFNIAMKRYRHGHGHHCRSLGRKVKRVKRVTGEGKKQGFSLSI
jgi:hypothetical protein